MKNYFLIPAIIFSGCTGDQEPKNQPPADTTSVADAIYEIKVHNQIMELDPSTGGRIKSLKIDGNDFLTGKSINADNWGSTFWPSPQSAWGWPPSAELDKNPYTVVEGDNSITMRSSRDPKLGYVFVKQITGNPADTSFIVKYTIINKSDSSRKVAPWEISRVFPNGITFYPTGEGDKRGDLAPLTKDIDGITWFQYKEDQIPSGVPKLLADGKEGWLAQLNNDWLLVKSFPAIPLEDNAPEEGEIELYTNPDKSYIEIEQQGAYQELAPGDSSVWEVEWILRKVPNSIKAEPGEKELVNFVRSLK